ncbi:hypothetical protein GCM10008995_04050 [Halobellus salinus]|uniref:Uncharacterized protein n=1 Tax=Halobellus salinus TaxID=931585 RepID=A0A830EJG7_9EURY|nr:hypothetical protein GCM10008995_04050 [Halobellus salinus]
MNTSRVPVCDDPRRNGLLLAELYTVEIAEEVRFRVHELIDHLGHYRLILNGPHRLRSLLQASDDPPVSPRFRRERLSRPAVSGGSAIVAAGVI